MGELVLWVVVGCQLACLPTMLRIVGAGEPGAVEEVGYGIVDVVEVIRSVEELLVRHQRRIDTVLKAGGLGLGMTL